MTQSSSSKPGSDARDEVARGIRRPYSNYLAFQRLGRSVDRRLLAQGNETFESCRRLDMTLVEQEEAAIQAALELEVHLLVITPFPPWYLNFSREPRKRQ